MTKHASEADKAAVASQARPAPGQVFPDLALPDHYGNPRRLSELAGGDPLLLQFYRGFWCPKEQAFFRGLVRLQERPTLSGPHHPRRVQRVLVLRPAYPGGAAPGVQAHHAYDPARLASAAVMSWLWFARTDERPLAAVTAARCWELDR